MRMRVRMGRVSRREVHMGRPWVEGAQCRRRIRASRANRTNRVARHGVDKAWILGVSTTSRAGPGPGPGPRVKAKRTDARPTEHERTARRAATACRVEACRILEWPLPVQRRRLRPRPAA
jgi:hypothetical protein